MVTETKNFNWHQTMLKPFLDRVVQVFGTKRLLFGPDWSVCLLARKYTSILQIIKNYFSDFSEGDQR